MTNNLFATYTEDSIVQFRDAFTKDNFVYLPGFLTDHGYERLKSIENNLSEAYMRKDFLMPQSNYSARKINVIGGKATNKNEELTSAYRDQELCTFLSTVVANPIAECDEVIENIIFTSLSDTGDTHGWHTDDYPIALIIGLEAAPEGAGGEVEFVDMQNNLRSVHLKKQDAYLMRSDLLKHRVSPLKKEAVRTILNFTYSFPQFSVKPNGSANHFCE